MRYPMGTLPQLGWTIGAAVSVINYCGHPNTYRARATGAGWFQLVPLASDEDRSPSRS